MVKTRLLQTICAAAMMAAVPAMAQTNSQPGDTGLGGAPNNPTAVPRGPSSTMPAERMGSPHGAMSMDDHHESMHMDDHHGSMHHHSGRHAAHMRAESAGSQSAAVDRLNEQSYMAARNGQAFTGAAPADTAMPGHAGSMTDMLPGSTPRGNVAK